VSEPNELTSEASGGRDGGESRVDRVIAHLRDHIARNGLRPGARLPSETRIAEGLGISRPIVREAMKTLAATGLIEMAVGRRATVSPLDGSIMRNVIENAVLVGQVDVGHVMEMRRGIEIAMVGLAATRRSDAQAAELQRIVGEMARRLDDFAGYIRFDVRFHLTLAEATANPLYQMLVEAFRQIFQSSMKFGIERWAATPELHRVQKLHEEVVAAIVARDADAATLAMQRHFDDAIRVMFGAIVPPSGPRGDESGGA
jgi:DNA-binding FadR family transcriptional regulator